MRQLNYTKAVIIVAGKSELQICQYLKNKFRLKIEIFSDKHGEKGIQITSLKNTLNNKIFKSQRSFLKEYDDVVINEDFKIFIIMDTDDCSEEQKNKFMNKEMFKDHWAYPYIVPIYDIPQLEGILTKANIPFEKKGDKRKKEYVKLFPTDPKYIKSDKIQVEELIKKLRKEKDTNLDLFFEFCISCASSNKL